MADNKIFKLREIAAKKTTLISRPSVINIELTGRCNFNPPCVFCGGRNISGYLGPGDISFALIRGYWPYLRQCERVNDCSYGEPLLYGQFELLVESLAAAGITFGFSTNGLLLDREKAEFLVRHAASVDVLVSVNAATQETYYKLHGQDFDKLVSNIRRFIDLHRATHGDRPLPLVLSYIVMHANLEEVDEFLKLANSLGIERVMLRHLFELDAFQSGEGKSVCNSFGYRFDYRREILDSCQYIDLENRIKGRPEFSNLNVSYQWNALESFISEQSQDGIDIPCLFPWKFLCIRNLFDIYSPCVFIKKGMASPSKVSIDGVWNGKTLISMRRSLASGKIPEFCIENGRICPLVREIEAPEGNEWHLSRTARKAIAVLIRRKPSIEYREDSSSRKLLNSTGREKCI